MRDSDSSDPAEAGERPKVVFFVDDHDLIRETTSELLKKRGYEVLLASSAEEASEVIESYDARAHPAV